MSSVESRLAAALANPLEVRELDLRGSEGDRLKALPGNICTLKYLEILRLDHNELERLPAPIGNLAKLRELHVAHNRLTSDGLPRLLWFLKSLEVLNLHGNQIAWVANLGTYQPTEFTLYLADNPIDCDRHMDANCRPISPMWSHNLHMLPLTRSGKFKLRNFSIDLERLAFPLPGPQLHHAPPFRNVLQIQLYGRAPTKEELAELGAYFPKAKITVCGPPETGPHLLREPEVRARPKIAAAASNARKPHPEQFDRLESLLAVGKRKKFDVEVDELRLGAALSSRKAKKAELSIRGASRLGGAPDVAAGFAWPLGERGAPMLFVGQIRLDEAARFDSGGILPDQGILSFFAGDVEDGRVYHFPDLAAVQPMPLEGEADFGGYPRGPFPAAMLDWHGHVSAPESSGDEIHEAIAKLTPRKATHRVLGHDKGDTAGLIDEEMVILLCVGSDEHSGMRWGDLGSLYFTLEREDLTRRDFEKVRVVSSV